MNRETSIHARDTLIVTERRQNRRWVIIAVVVVALLAIGLIVMKGHGGDILCRPIPSPAGTALAFFQPPSRPVRLPYQRRVG